MLLHEARLPRPERSAATRPADDPQREGAARLRWWRLAAVTLALIALSVSLRSRESASTTSPIVASTPTTSSPATASRTKPIRDIEVGERVLAENPEFEANRRVGSEEPDWSQWLRLSLVMVKADGSELNIELLRSEDWIASHLLLAVQRQAPIGLKDQTSPVIQAAASENVPYSILRPLYQDFIAQQGLLDAAGIATVGCFVELNLPELGVTGVALVRQLRPAPDISPGTGSVVTATFQHSGGNVIDVIIGNDREHETIGTTDNHPFWSEDQQRYVPAGKLLTGERVRTYLGDTQHIVAVKPRPGPEEVYNLEVHGEHVYYVGRFGTLVHNSRGYANTPDRPLRYQTIMEKFDAYRSRGGKLTISSWATKNRARDWGIDNSVSGFRRWSRFIEHREFHHFATDKHSIYTPLMEAITRRYGLELDADWNKMLLPHRGRHTHGYHDWVLLRMQRADRKARGDVTVFLREFHDSIIGPVVSDPGILYR